MVTTLQSSGLYGTTDETNSVLGYLAGYRSHTQIIKEYFGIQDEDFRNTKKLEKMGVKWMPRLGELGVTKEKFDFIFKDVLYGDNERESSESDNLSTDGTESDAELPTAKKRTRKSS